MYVEIIQWTSVKDRLPDDEMTVLINTPELNEPVWFGYFLGGFWFLADGCRIGDESVTHWADMPAGVEITT